MNVERVDDKFFRFKGAHPKLKEFIRFSIPIDYRYFDGAHWCVHKDHVKDALKYGLKFHESKVDKGGRAASLAGSLNSDSYAVLHLRPTAPISLVKAAYKALSKQLHPDAGGDEEEFKRLTEAYNKVVNEHSG